MTSVIRWFHCTPVTFLPKVPGSAVWSLPPTNMVTVGNDDHHSKFMNSQLKILKEAGVIKSTHTREQGFIDNQGNFLTREEACVVAREAGQINQVRLKTTPFRELFSEDLY